MIETYLFIKKKRDHGLQKWDAMGHESTHPLDSTWWIEGSKDPPFRKLLRSSFFFRWARAQRRRCTTKAGIFRLALPCLEMAIFFTCCSFCICQLAKEWREKWNYYMHIYIYRTAIMIIPYIFLLSKLPKIQPPWLCQHPEKNSSSYCDNSLHFTSLGSKDMPRNPSPTSQPTRWSKATQLLVFNKLSIWSKHATSRMSIILNTSRGVTKIQPIFSNLLGPEQRP